MVLKLIIHTLASPRRQRSYWGLRVTQNAYFSYMTHTKQLLSVTFCDIRQEFELFFGHSDTRTEDGRRTDGGRTDRRGSRNSYLDFVHVYQFNLFDFR